MRLTEMVLKTPLLRPNTLPPHSLIGLVCFPSALENIPNELLDAVSGVFVIGHDSSLPQFLKCTSKNGVNKDVPLLPYTKLKEQLCLEIVFFHHEYDYKCLVSSAFYLRQIQVDTYYNASPLPYNRGITTTHMPTYYSSHKESLEHVFQMLEDDASRQVMAARIRALETGNIGYIAISRFAEYFHPEVQPTEGDVILDGGVSESIMSQVKMSQAIGPDGKMYGFEPDPDGFREAKKGLEEKAPHSNYKIIPLGLWNEKDTLRFRLDGQATSVVSDSEGDYASCDVISIDEFVQSTHQKKVDFIKLDVEGAERNALKGARETIDRFKPKLAVSIYHLHNDLYDLCRYVDEVSDDYVFYMGQHHNTLRETVLYGKPRQ